MKKYLLGVFAVILAVGFSAFTKAPAVKKSGTSMYWYVVDYSTSPSGRVISNNGYLFGGAVPKAQAQEEDDCIDQDDLHCLRGFTNPLPANQIVSTFEDSTPRKVE